MLSGKKQAAENMFLLDGNEQCWCGEGWWRGGRAALAEARVCRAGMRLILILRRYKKDEGD
ncbi:hypothetical protein Defa_15110 [Desulfovibrio sp. TH_2024_36128]|uniref:Uncharacterized protein n=1 Tax=Desulfovibrio falkowii TaxID=3136602 RepID=A0ABQ0E8N8_9BACT